MQDLPEALAAEDRFKDFSTAGVYAGGKRGA